LCLGENDITENHDPIWQLKVKEHMFLLTKARKYYFEIIVLWWAGVNQNKGMRVLKMLNCTK
jgi:hypothetical protein